MGGVCPKSKLWNDLQERDCRALEEFYVRAEKYLHVENTVEAFEKIDSPIKSPKEDKKEKRRKNEESKKRKNEESKPNNKKR